MMRQQEVCAHSACHCMQAALPEQDMPEDPYLAQCARTHAEVAHSKAKTHYRLPYIMCCPAQQPRECACASGGCSSPRWTSS